MEKQLPRILALMIDQLAGHSVDGVRSGQPAFRRRASMVLSGGVLPAGLRGQQVEEAEVIDIPATIADIYGVSYGGDGVSVLSRL